MHISFWAVTALSVAVCSLAIPLYVDQLSLRTYYDWSTIPADKKLQQVGRLQPAPGESDPHITYRKSGDPVRNPPVHVDQYQVWKPNVHKPGSMANGGRWRGNDDIGKPHGGIPPPIWYPPAGEVKGNKAYPATENQHPPSYNLVKFSKSIKGKVANMPSSGNPQGKSKDDLAVEKARR